MPSEGRCGKDKNTKNWQGQGKKAVTEQTDEASLQLFISYLEVGGAGWWVAHFAGGERVWWSGWGTTQNCDSDTALQKLSGSSWSTYIFSTYFWAFGTVQAIPEFYWCDLGSLDKTHCQHQDYRKSNQSVKRFYLKSMSPLKIIKRECKIIGAEVAFC